MSRRASIYPSVELIKPSVGELIRATENDRDFDESRVAFR